jgi:2-oxoglutarate ferredoxin oxidoreductase subunit beta
MSTISQDWELDSPRYFTLEDFEGGVARWCPGCGDHGVLTAVQRICRDKQLPPEKVVAVSGIGCSSRFPHYMKTYGFHGLHGRALPVACGIRSRRPDLHVWVATGDGDCCSIGAGHWVHAIRYNMNMTVMMFDNRVYGLTKDQTSPTTPTGWKTNTHPRGAWLPPLNPLSATLGFSNVSFVAQTVDWNPVHLHATLQHAFEHRGLSFVRILQRCPVFTGRMYLALQDDPSKILLLHHDKSFPIDPALKRIFPTQQAHDPADMKEARELVERDDLVPIGLLFQDPTRPVYEEYTSEGLDMSVEEKQEGIRREFDRFAI